MLIMAEAFDVAVVGGGGAGIAAAVSAARLGVRTLLLERSDVLGGNAGNALVHTICGLYLPASDGDAVYAHEGFPREFSELLVAAGGAAEAEKAGRVWVLPTYPHVLAQTARDLCDRTDNLTVWMGCEVVEAEVDSSVVRLRVARRAEAHFVRAAVCVDASGDASLAALAGAAWNSVDGDRLQNPSFIVRLRGVPSSATDGFARMRLSTAVARAERLQVLPPGAGSILVRPGPTVGEAYLTLNVPKPSERPYSPLDEAEVEDLGAIARDHVEAVVSFLRSSRDGFEECEVVEWPRRIGVRETRRIVGRSVVEASDILSGRRSDDEVALSTWPIEIWDDHKGARFEYPHAPTSVPLGALICRDYGRIGAAGRCLSATHEALGALRVIGTSMATGEAIGITSALAAKAATDLAEIDPVDVRALRARS